MFDDREFRICGVDCNDCPLFEDCFVDAIQMDDDNYDDDDEYYDYHPYPEYADY